MNKYKRTFVVGRCSMSVDKKKTIGLSMAKFLKSKTEIRIERYDPEFTSIFGINAILKKFQQKYDYKL